MRAEDAERIVIVERIFSPLQIDLALVSRFSALVGRRRESRCDPASLAAREKHVRQSLWLMA
jgi:hypothetical protein